MHINTNAIWNLFFAISATALFGLYCGVRVVMYPVQAEAMAERLAPRVGVDEELLRDALSQVLRAGNLRETVFIGSLMGVLVAFLWIRCIATCWEMGAAWARRIAAPRRVCEPPTIRVGRRAE